LGRPDVVAIEADVLPAERGNVGEQLVGQSFGLGAKLGNGVAEVDGVPEDDGGDVRNGSSRRLSRSFRQLHATRVALDEIIITQASDDSDQLPPFPVRSELAATKDGTGAVKVETVLDEIAKLKQLRALGLP
jgi:hypothetical protein